MAQVMVNFRIDEDVKRSMEQACREMGLSMTTAFTIFATKVGKEKRIPFEITADPYGAERGRLHAAKAASDEAVSDFDAALEERREQTERLCAQLRRSLTHIHTAIPASIPGLTVERIRLLCCDELKDKVAEVSAALRGVLADREVMREKDAEVLDEYLSQLASIAEEVRSVEYTLAPAFKSCAGGAEEIFAACEQRLSGVSRAFDGLQTLMQRFAQSSARKKGSAEAVRARLQKETALLSHPEVRSALGELEELVQRHYDTLDQQTKNHLEFFYLQTLELVLSELRRAEQTGEETAGKAALCLRVIHVLNRVVVSQGQVQSEHSDRELEAEVTALERLAAMRGEIGEDIAP